MINVDEQSFSIQWRTNEGNGDKVIIYNKGVINPDKGGVRTKKESCRQSSAAIRPFSQQSLCK